MFALVLCAHALVFCLDALVFCLCSRHFCRHARLFSDSTCFLCVRTSVFSRDASEFCFDADLLVGCSCLEKVAQLAFGLLDLCKQRVDIGCLHPIMIVGRRLAAYIGVCRPPAIVVVDYKCELWIECFSVPFAAFGQQYLADSDLLCHIILR